VILPAADYRKTRINDPRKLHKGLDAVVYGFLGTYQRRAALRLDLLKEAETIHDQSERLKTLASKELESRLRSFKNLFRRQDEIDGSVVSEALAVLVETASRTVGLRPYPVQVAGALAMHRGYLAEMATGEGKSLTACMPAALSAWTGRPCHIVTVNDYLACRDVAEMKSFYEACGLTVGAVTAEMAQTERRANYDKGVVYTTSKELTADFLRDRLTLGPIQNPSRRLIRGFLYPQIRANEGMVMRGLHTAIVDEADSVLIDEAVTPLIISRPQENRPFVDVCIAAGSMADQLVPVKDYTCNMRYKDIRLTREGEKKLEGLAGDLKGLWQSKDRREELMLQALTAREFYRRDKQYVVQDGRVVIVDEFTGRLMPNRTWRQGFHQAVEAKEGLEVTNPSETLSRLSFQQFFRLFEKMSGMTGTGLESSREFWQIYGLAVMTIPTNRPCIREQYPSLIFATSAERWSAVVDEVQELHRVGRPVLVGTRNVAASEKIADLLAEKGLAFSLLNAVHHQEEAGIVRSAGQESRITIATNMAGRGTDIKLGDGVAELGGLHVIATEGHESARIDRQLFGRSARQGDPGSSRAFMSLEDELIVRFVPAPVRNRLAMSLAPNHASVRAFAEKVYKRAQTAAQNMAFKQRKSVLRMDTWLEEALAFTGKSVLGG
jgi:preprotein translocase subunit SecA